VDDPSPFLQVIFDEPEEDAPRLIYADWLEDQGESDLAALAAYIRTECELARLPADDPERTALENRSQALFEQCEGIWGLLGADVRSERGLAVAEMPLEDFLDRRGELERCPALLGVCAVVRERGLKRLARELWPTGMRLPRLCGLILEDVDPETIDILLKSPFLAQLDELSLRSWDLDEDKVVADLAHSCPGDLPRLRRLSWSCWSLRSSGAGLPLFPGTVVHLATSPEFPRLTQFEMTSAPRLSDHWGWPNRLARAMHGPTPPVELDLSFSGQAFSLDVLRSLGQRPAVAPVRTLRLRWNGLPGDCSVFQVLAAGNHWSSLEELDIGNAAYDEVPIPYEERAHNIYIEAFNVQRSPGLDRLRHQLRKLVACYDDDGHLADDHFDRIAGQFRALFPRAEIILEGRWGSGHVQLPAPMDASA
jgi:uncharacterized protein (TIGR02996 family)